MKLYMYQSRYFSNKITDWQSEKNQISKTLYVNVKFLFWAKIMS